MYLNKATKAAIYVTNYCETHKTVNIRNICGMLLSCVEEIANMALEN